MRIRLAFVSLVLLFPIAAVPAAAVLKWSGRASGTEVTISSNMIAAIFSCESKPLACPGVTAVVLHMANRGKAPKPAIADPNVTFVRKSHETLKILTNKDISEYLSSEKPEPVLMIDVIKINRNRARARLFALSIHAVRKIGIGCGEAEISIKNEKGTWVCD
jgi:hypothetical protein